LALDQKFLNPKIHLFQLWIYCQNQYVQLWHKIKSFFKAKNTIIRTFDLVQKSAPTTFGTRLKVFKIIELVPVANFYPYVLANITFDLVIKVASSYFGTRLKVGHPWYREIASSMTRVSLYHSSHCYS
jgi:hypothetical protein